MKIGVFSDPHFCNATQFDTRRPSLSYGKLQTAMTEFKKQNVDIVFCLGDLTDHEAGEERESVYNNFKKITELIYSFGIPFYLVPGNHDYLMLSASELQSDFNLRTPPYVIECEKYSFILLDANYRSNMVRFDTAGVQWDDSNLPREQVDFLKNALDVSKKECIVLVHENLDPCVDKNHIIKNATEVRRVISHSKKVKLVIQGHYHWGAKSVIDGVTYLTLPAMCEGENNPYFVFDLD